MPLLVALSGWRGRPGRLPGQPPLRAFALGLTSGRRISSGTIYWTGTVSSTFGGLHPARRDDRDAAAGAVSGDLSGADGAHHEPSRRARRRARALFFAPAAWVATEFVRGYLFGGFPWVPLGNSQVTVLPVAQLASVLGVYGLSALVAFVNAALAFALLTAGRARVCWRSAPRRSSSRRRCVGHVADRRRLADARGHAAPGRARAGQHRAGRQVEPARGAADLHDLHRDDARCRSGAARSS